MTEAQIAEYLFAYKYKLQSPGELLGKLKIEWDSDSIKFTPTIDSWKNYMLELFENISKEIT